MNKLFVILLLALVAAGYYLAPRFLHQKDEQVFMMKMPQSCNFDRAACAVVLPGDQKVSVVVEGEVKPLGIFFIQLSGIQLQTAEVEFEMVGMDMGLNRYRFSRQEKQAVADDGKESWVTSAQLPVCTTGRQDWMAHIRLVTNEGLHYQLEYPFETSDGGQAK